MRLTPVPVAASAGPLGFVAIHEAASPGGMAVRAQFPHRVRGSAIEDRPDISRIAPGAMGRFFASDNLRLGSADRIAPPTGGCSSLTFGDFASAVNAEGNSARRQTVGEKRRGLVYPAGSRDFRIFANWDKAALVWCT